MMPPSRWGSRITEEHLSLTDLGVSENLYSDDVGCLDSDKFEHSSVTKVLKRKFVTGDQELDEGFYLDNEDLCVDEESGFDINWLMQCLDSDQKENTVDMVVRKKVKLDDQESDEFEGGLCLDDLSGGVFCFDEHCDMDIDCFIRCLDSEQEKRPNQDTSTSKLVKTGYGPEFGEGLCLDDLSGGVFCFDEHCDLDIDWFIRCLDSDQERSQIKTPLLASLEKQDMDLSLGGMGIFVVMSLTRNGSAALGFPIWRVNDDYMFVAIISINPNS